MNGQLHLENLTFAKQWLAFVRKLTSTTQWHQCGKCCSPNWLVSLWNSRNIQTLWCFFFGSKLFTRRKRRRGTGCAHRKQSIGHSSAWLFLREFSLFTSSSYTLVQTARVTHSVPTTDPKSSAGDNWGLVICSEILQSVTDELTE